MPGVKEYVAESGVINNRTPLNMYKNKKYTEHRKKTKSHKNNVNDKS